MRKILVSLIFSPPCLKLAPKSPGAARQPKTAQTNAAAGQCNNGQPAAGALPAGPQCTRLPAGDIPSSALQIRMINHPLLARSNINQLCQLGFDSTTSDAIGSPVHIGKFPGRCRTTATGRKSGKGRRRLFAKPARARAPGRPLAWRKTPLSAMPGRATHSRPVCWPANFTFRPVAPDRPMANCADS